MLNNPFTCDSATAFPIDKLAKIYVDDYNCSGLIRSQKNLMLVGERGAGKSMAFLFNSLECQLYKKKAAPAYIGIYIPCKTELSLAADIFLYQEKVNLALAEHYLCIVIAHSLVRAFENANIELPNVESQKILAEELGYSYFDNIPFRDNLYYTLNSYFKREVQKVKKHISDLGNTSKLVAVLHSFQSLILPLIDTLERIYPIESPHFCLMFDDAYKFNSAQMKVLNTYFSYRDRSKFSFKAALTSTQDYDFRTSNNISILKGHDYDLLLLEGDFQNTRSTFYKMAVDVLKERLKLIDEGISDVESFFPANQSYIDGLENSRKKVFQEAERLHPDDIKKRQNHVYKYGVVEYYSSRIKSKSNHPPYSGLELIISVSTGVLRQLLLPCCLMYEREIKKRGSQKVTYISSETQTSVLKELSDKLWAELEQGVLHRTIDGCSKNHATKLYNLLNSLGDLFRCRLIEGRSEPRAVTFTLSELKHPRRDELQEVLDIGRRAMLIFTREGSAKDLGRRQVYYTPNRLLWIARGLDPCGQNSRVSIKVSELAKGMDGEQIREASIQAEDSRISHQGSFFDE